MANAMYLQAYKNQIFCQDIKVCISNKLSNYLYIIAAVNDYLIPILMEANPKWFKQKKMCYKQ